MNYAHNISFATANKRMTITYTRQTGGSSSNGSTSDTTTVTAADFAAGAGKVAFDSNTATTNTKTTGKPLTLQIGDTSDKFNQMDVSIKDMHAAAMGKGTYKDGYGAMKKSTNSIKTINIGTREGAQEAVATIKNAINYVSSVHGTLGAAQNRLEHTQNNLSVMAENIQDAESSIRDTDVAEEMMSYVKNNNLVQSAQAMLAQANQVPQGVLQLLG